MRLLISDANILIDMEAGALMETLFQLPMQFGIPDLLYYEEIEPGSPGLEDLGLQVMEVNGDFVAYAEQLPGQHNHLLPAKNGPKPSHNDYLALALAKQETCTLLTGDANLRIVANKEQVNVMGICPFWMASISLSMRACSAISRSMRRNLSVSVSSASRAKASMTSVRRLSVAAECGCASPETNRMASTAAVESSYSSSEAPAGKRRSRNPSASQLATYACAVWGKSSPWARSSSRSLAMRS